MKRFPYIAHAIIFSLLVLFDQITKIFARNSIKEQPVSIIKDVFSLQYLENRGSIWGILQGKVDILLIFSVFLFLLLIYVYIKTPKTAHYHLFFWVLVVIGAGAVGNTIDRLFFGFVTDFLYFELINFPIFNVADCYITVCAFFIAYLILFGKYKDDEFRFLSLRRKEVSNAADTNADEN